MADSERDIVAGLLCHVTEALAVAVGDGGNEVIFHRYPLGVEWRERLEDAPRAVFRTLLAKVADTLGLNSGKRLAREARRIAVAVPGIDPRFSTWRLLDDLESVGCVRSCQRRCKNPRIAGIKFPTRSLRRSRPWKQEIQGAVTEFRCARNRRISSTRGEPRQDQRAHGI